jgi:acyl-coenzyme A thioesterase PaaI-like protein
MNEWEMDECITSTLDEECDIINDDDEEEVVYNDGVDEYRCTNGWIGSDLCHSRHSSVRISHYTISYNDSHSNTTLMTDGGRGGVGTKLTGLCHFTESAESHKGYCHGGSMTAVMDDIIGWTAFCVTGQCIPWSGYTVQINVTLKHPVQIGSYLILRGAIVKWDGRRKVWVEATLFSNGCCSSSDEMKIENKCSDDEEIVYCTAEGLVLLNNDVINLV